MKIIHIADTHLGANPHANNTWKIDREKEIWKSFEQVVKKAEEEKADILLIAGDMFHRQPLVRELKELNYIFSNLTHTKVVIIAGNHDYIKSNSYYKTFAWEKHVHFLKSNECESVYFEDLNTEVYGFSYDNYEIKENRYRDIKIQHKNRINILLAHGGDEKHIPFTKADLNSLGFDYIALGHIHMPGMLIPNKIAYAGALEPIDIADEGAHGYLNVEVNKQEAKIKFISFAKREYKTIEIQSDCSFTNTKLQDIIKEKIQEIEDRNSFVKIIIKGYRDEDIYYDVDEIYSLGLVVLVTDLTEPDYDFDRLAKEYSKNIIGKFIQDFKTDHMTDIEKKALYFGVKAMLDEMG